MKKYYIFILLGCLFLSACKKEEAPTDGGTENGGGGGGNSGGQEENTLKIRKVLPLEWQFYDENDSLTSRYQYQYDELDRVTRVDFSFGSQLAGASFYSITTFDNDQHTGVTRSYNGENDTLTGYSEMKYKEDNVTLLETKSFDTDGELSNMMTYMYDANNRLIRMDFIYGGSLSDYSSHTIYSYSKGRMTMKGYHTDPDTLTSTTETIFWKETDLPQLTTSYDYSGREVYSFSREYDDKYRETYLKTIYVDLNIGGETTSTYDDHTNTMIRIHRDSDGEYTGKQETVYKYSREIEFKLD